MGGNTDRASAAADAAAEAAAPVHVIALSRELLWAAAAPAGLSVLDAGSASPAARTRQQEPGEADRGDDQPCKRTTATKANGTLAEADRSRARQSVAQTTPVDAPWSAGASTVRTNSICSMWTLSPPDNSSAVSP
jgi:hypothetical protein